MATVPVQRSWQSQQTFSHRVVVRTRGGGLGKTSRLLDVHAFLWLLPSLRDLRFESVIDMSLSSHCVTQFVAALSACDDVDNYEALIRRYDADVEPALSEMLLHSPLRGDALAANVPVSAIVDPLLLSSARKAVAAHDDVRLFVMRSVAACLKQQQQRASSSPLHATTETFVGAKRARRDERQATDSSTAKLPTLTALCVNAFALLFGLRPPTATTLTLRWGRVLMAKRDAVQQSALYKNANSAERRKMNLKTAMWIFSDASHRSTFSHLWLTFVDCLGHCGPDCPLNVHLFSGLGEHVLPFVSHAVEFSDCLTRHFSMGGLSAVLSLQGMFVLMVDHGLEYPEFYDKLYSLVTPDALVTRHRSTLFRLMDAALTSLRVPGYVVAGFIKRIARVSLVSPMPVLYFTLPFVRQLLQRHPNTLRLIHRGKNVGTDEAALTKRVSQNCSDAAAGEDVADEFPRKDEDARREARLWQGCDPYDAQAEALADCHALQSTLWELAALERHVLPGVQAMVTALASPAEDHQPLTFDKSYNRIFSHDVAKPLSRDACALAYRHTLMSSSGLSSGHLPSSATTEGPSLWDCNEIGRAMLSQSA
mgnify:FL=1